MTQLRITPTPLTYSVSLLYGPTGSPDGQGNTSGVELNYPNDIRERLLLIFADPVHTLFQLQGVEAKVIKKEASATKIASFSPGLLFAQGFTPEETGATATSLYKMLTDLNPHLQLRSFATRFEFEFSLQGVTSVGNWIADRFIMKNVALPDGWSVPSAKVAFRVKRAEGVEYSVRVEPRAGKAEYFFILMESGVEPLGVLDPSDVGDWTRQIEEGFERA